MNIVSFITSHIANLKVSAKVQGFTIVELLIVISITVILAGLSLNAYPSYSRAAEFENVVIDVALLIREAQVFGSGTRQASGVVVDFDVAYGITFIKDSSTIIFFVDRNGNGVYDGTSSEIERELELKPGFTVGDLCLASCINERFDISFKRPIPEARVVVNGIGGFATYTDITIQMKDPSGVTRDIKVFPTGQISIQ